MYFDPKKSCFVADDGSKLKLTESLVTKFPLQCFHRINHDAEKCEQRLFNKYKNYLLKELGAK